MPDVVVTVPKNFEYAGLVGLEAWVKEGDAAGSDWSGEEWHFYLGGPPPNILRGERVYVVNNGKLRGYAPLVRVERYGNSHALVRHGGAVAVTIDEPIQGFRGFRYRWWKYEDENSSICSFVRLDILFTPVPRLSGPDHWVWTVAFRNQFVDFFCVGFAPASIAFKELFV